MQKVLVICSHPDDEILGLGGTLRKHVLSGDEVYCLILGEGAVMRETENGNLIRQSREAGKIIGFKEMYFESFPDNRMDTVSLADICQIVESHVQEVRPDRIYTHHNDLNIDYCLTSKAVLTACRPN